MTFDWKGAIERNFDAIERIVAHLHALAGIGSGLPMVDTLPRYLHTRILSILRPAEFAARRLIVMAACTLGLLPPPRRRGQGAVIAPPPGREPARAPVPAFQLFDPFKPFGEPWLTPEEIAALGRSAEGASWPRPAPPPHEPVDARALCRRIAALRHALEDLDGQALRLARWRARGAAEASSSRVRPDRLTPLRPGRPPGWKRRPKTAVEEVLKECHFLALEAWAGPDTS